MRRLTLLAIAGLLVLAAGLSVSAKVTVSERGASEAPSAPDVLVVVLDSWRADALDRQVGEVPVMPRLREWSKRAAVFSEARAPSPSTPTSVSSLFTSLSVRAFGGTFSKGIPERAVTLAELLRDTGYATLALSANPNCRVAVGHGQGFDVFEEVFADPEFAKGERRIRGDHPAMLVPPEKLLGLARERLEEAGDRKPVFAYVHLLQPHAPYRAAQPHFGSYIREGMPVVPLEIQALAAREKAEELDAGYLEALRAHYDAHVSWSDAALGNFLDWVDGHPRWSRAAILVTSDHGEAFGEHGRLMHNTTLFEEMLRIPFLLRLPGGPHEGRTIDARVGLIDVLPTLAAWAGVEPPELAEGVDLTPLARGESIEARRRFLATTAREIRTDALLIGSRKLICADVPAEERVTCSLYDLADDPGEVTDLSQIRVVQRDAMTRGLEKLIERHESSDLGVAPSQTPSENVQSILKSLGYTGGD